MSELYDAPIQSETLEHYFILETKWLKNNLVATEAESNFTIVNEKEKILFPTLLW